MTKPEKASKEARLPALSSPYFFMTAKRHGQNGVALLGMVDHTQRSALQRFSRRSPP